MKLRKNDLIELKKAGQKAILAKLAELKRELSKTKLEASRGKVKNLKAAKLLRRNLARLKTIQSELEMTQL